ncbi:peptidoglycan DD-metalloendopeptidase family protein [Cognatishimia sp. F0-27]|uniref:peptidoglycan DD-metalloendopeptidase family protein n=1 Tax=Cognatishimia sp. F0-27 TaxID=2816855 RepID=UPI001D0C3DDA|nr:peptidoglycan DD-metalloendopeptidase family protein [Cognatishimia sp. F0-27]MCC1492484.1 peptidoglycan DD-metalloendopeptidase family protein [Cognatishimia sp. F0-27]
MPPPRIDYDTIPALAPGQSIRVYDYIDFFNFTSNGYSGSDLLAINLRDDTAGGGYFSFNGTIIPSGQTVDFFRDASSIQNSFEYLLSDILGLRFHAGTSNAVDSLVINGAIEGYGNIGAEYGSVQTVAPNPTPEVNVFQATSSSMTEGGSITYTIQLSEPSNTNVTVGYELRGRGAFVDDRIDANDVTTSSASFFIPAGQTTGQVTVFAVLDGVYDGGPEGYTLELNSVSGNATLGGSTQFIGTVFDADPAPTVPGQLSINRNQVSVNEGDSGTTPVTFTVTRSGGDDGFVSASWQLVHASTSPNDFAGSQSGTVSFVNGSTAAQTITVFVNGDTDYTDADLESFQIVLSNPTGGATIGTSTASMDIVDDDDAPVTPPGLSGPPYVVPLPFEAGIDSLVMQIPGSGQTHKGYVAQAYDFSLPFGTPVLAVADGEVVDYVDHVPDGPNIRPVNSTDADVIASLGTSNIGNMVTLRHTDANGNFFYTSYFHLMGPDNDGSNVPAAGAQTVQAGEVIGYIGRTGTSYGPEDQNVDHLHFQYSNATIQFRAGLVADASVGRIPADFVQFEHANSTTGSSLAQGSSYTSTTQLFAPGGGGGASSPFTTGDDDEFWTGRTTAFALAGNDTITGNADDNRLLGQSGNDTLLGASGDDWLDGGTGPDMLHGGAGDDTIIGGTNFDTVRYTNIFAPVSLNLEAGRATGGGGQDTVLQVEHAVGSASNDVIYGTRIHGNRIEGDSGRDSLYGLDGDDTLLGGASDDALYGGSDEDLLDGGAQDDRLFGGDASDTLLGGAHADRLEGEDGADSLDGGSGPDTLLGGSGDDTLAGGSNFDTVLYSGTFTPVQVNLQAGQASGGGGNDQISTIEHVFGSGSHDTIYGTALHGNRLEGSNGNDTIYGLAGADTILGGNGADRLLGGADGDRIFGGPGADYLDGGPGRDLISGGPGADNFVFRDINDIGVGQFRRDEVRDFSAAEGDVINLYLIDANIGAPGNQAFSVVNSFGGNAGEMTLLDVVRSGVTVTIASLDVDGDASADGQIYIVGGAEAGDFLL